MIRSPDPRPDRVEQGAASPGSITDVKGIRVGHFTDRRRPTGCTVILAEDGAVGGVDVRGAAPGTRETDLLEPGNLVERVHAVLLSGGSAFGLDAASGVVRWLESRGIGLPVGPARIPIVPAAILFDLLVGDHRIRPDAEAGWQACEAASAAPPAEGTVGAGAGASVGKLFGIGRAMKGGIGTASVRVGSITVGAIVAVNAVGDVIDPRSGTVIAGARTVDGGHPLRTADAMLRGQWPAASAPVTPPGAATTIGLVACDAVLDKARVRKLAQIAHDGLARTIDPAHTLYDGDTVFALATGAAGQGADPTVLGVAAAHAMAEAVLRAVRRAEGVTLPGGVRLPSARELGWSS